MTGLDIVRTCMFFNTIKICFPNSYRNSKNFSISDVNCWNITDTSVCPWWESEAADQFISNCCSYTSSHRSTRENLVLPHVAGFKSQVPRCRAVLSTLQEKGAGTSLDNTLQWVRTWHCLLGQLRSVMLNVLCVQMGQDSKGNYRSTCTCSVYWLAGSPCAVMPVWCLWRRLGCMEKRAPTPHTIHFKGIVCGLPIQPWSAWRSPIQHLLWEQCVHRCLGTPEAVALSA